MKGWFIYLFPVLLVSSYNCLAEGHEAYAHFQFCNSLKTRTVTLKPESKCEDSLGGFEDFVETEVLPHQRLFFKEELKGYQELQNLEEVSHPLLVIGVYLGGVRVGTVRLIKTLRPDPSFTFKTEENNLGLELRMQRSRFGGGSRTIEIAPRSRLQR